MNTMRCTKALNRLEGVYSDDSIIHATIQRALDLGCTNEKFVYERDLISIDCQRTHIASMKTEAGNSYGRYFIGIGSGANAQVCFAPAVWRRMKTLGWVA